MSKDQDKCPKCGKNAVGTVVDGMCVWCWRDKWDKENADLRRQLEQAKAEHRAWANFFGTTQLTHAAAVRDAAREKARAATAKLDAAQAENKKLHAGPEWTAFENELERRLALRVQEIEDGWRQEIITASEVRDKADAKNEKLRAIVDTYHAKPKKGKCGDCYHWMKTTCVPEKQWGQFKSCYSLPCKDFTRGPQCAQLNAAAAKGGT